MKIASYNMQHDKKGRTNWGKVLDEVGPDILLAQESLPPTPEDPWYESTIWSPVTSAWGSAVYSKSRRPKPLHLSSFEGWVVGVEIDEFSLGSATTTLRAFSVHAPTGQGTYQRAVNSILDMIGELRGESEVVIGGDFNLTVSERRLDGDRVVKKGDLAIQARLRDEFGLINCWQSRNPDASLAQTLRWDREPTTPYHCDGVFVPESWAERLKSCDVLAGDGWKRISDHNPVVDEFR